VPLCGGGLALAVASRLARATAPIVSPVRVIGQVATCVVRS
jgi:hypothetical protein